MRWLPLLLLALAACEGPTDDDDSVGEPGPPAVPGECEDALQDPWTADLLAGLDAVGGLDSAYWADHEADAFATVLFAEVDAGTCAVLHRGEVRAYGLLPEPPSMLTPLFGYQLPWTDGPDWVQPLGGASQQPAEWVDWLTDSGVDRATFLPAHEVTGVGFPVSALSHLQIAVHEGFHVDVQAPAWFGRPEHPWPSWDQQPNRSQLPNCYADAVMEQTRLANALEAAWARDLPGALEEYDGFWDARGLRRLDLAGTPVTAADGSSIDCEHAEAILELEEGLAEYAAWAMLRDAGGATDAEVLTSLRATTSEPFYKYGAGQALLVQALDPAGFPQWIQTIAASDSHTAGSIEAATREAINALR